MLAKNRKNNGNKVGVGYKVARKLYEIVSSVRNWLIKRRAGWQVKIIIFKILNIKLLTVKPKITNT